MSSNYTYIDLFSGCGGLSLGLEKAGFDLALSVEKSDMAAETFYHNFVQRIKDKDDWKRFCELSIEEQAEKKLVVDEVGALLKSKSLLKKLRDQEIDLVAGGPPCQGFSLAGRRNPDDARNELPWQFLEVVEAVRPRAVIIENVVGMSQNFSKHDKEAPFDQLKKALEATGEGYVAQQVLLNAMHFGVPQHRPRVLILALRSDQTKNYKTFDGVWRSDFDAMEDYQAKRPDIAPDATHFGDAIKTVEDALWDINNKGYRYAQSHEKYMSDNNLANVLRTDQSWMSSDVKDAPIPKSLQNHNLRNHADHIITRFRLYQVLRDCNLSSNILNIPKKYPEFEAEAMLKQVLQDIDNPFVAPDKTVIAKDKNALIDLICSLGTKKHSQRPLQWDAPSPTVVSLPDDYVHPSIPRTLTVREMARFQSFPDSFIFRSKETTGSHRRRFEVPQYTQVGNAVPPLMAEAIGKKFREILENTSSVNSKQKIAA